MAMDETVIIITRVVLLMMLMRMRIVKQFTPVRLVRTLVRDLPPFREGTVFAHGLIETYVWFGIPFILVCRTYTGIFAEARRRV